MSPDQAYELMQDRNGVSESLRREISLAMREWNASEVAVFLDSLKITPRIVLVGKIRGQPRLPASLPAPNSNEHTEFNQSYSIRDLTVKSLDTPLDGSALKRFLISLRSCGAREKDPNVYTSAIKRCAACRITKFSAEPSSPSPILLKLNEYSSTSPWPRQGQVLCSQSICSKCLVNAITTSIKHKLFNDLDKTMWFRCPVDGCDEFLPIAHLADMTTVLHRLGSQPKEVDTQIALWERAVAVRRALIFFQPWPSVRALELSAAIHAQLRLRKVARSFFDPYFPPQSTTPDDEGRLVEFTADPIKMLPCRDGNEGGGGLLLVPFLTKFLKRTPASEARRCEGCFELWCEIDYGSLEEWIETCRPFPGPWMWKILVFSEMLTANCHHKSEYCIKCLVKHITTSMENSGCFAVDNIRCPSEDCGRYLSDEEVQCYLEDEAKEKYQRLVCLKSISKLPNFRWCSRGGCKSGQAFGPGEVKEGLPVQCRECGFDMCFSHQVPWHQGMTCEEYEISPGHRDRYSIMTQRWMGQNAKRCPGKNCGILITKEEGCFHMECPSCFFEFCWECLADWNLIYPEEGGISRREAHNDGCFFRTSFVSPYVLHGSTLEQALEEMQDSEDEDMPDVE